MLVWIGLTFACSLILLGNQHRKVKPYQFVEMDYDLPIPLQLVAAMGDRYLAANIATWRAIVAKPENMTPGMLATMAKLQVDASWLNPAHEDNYYIAAAILPWGGQVQAAQTILQRATESRTRDENPPFFLGFNSMYFFGDYRAAASAAVTAARHAESPGTKSALMAIAAKWAERVGDIEVAQKVLEGIGKSARDLTTQREIEQRVERLAMLARLREAAKRYQQDNGRPPMSLDELVAAKLIRELPQDSLGVGFAIVGGEPVIRSHIPKRRQEVLRKE